MHEVARSEEPLVTAHNVTMSDDMPSSMDLGLMPRGPSLPTMPNFELESDSITKNNGKDKQDHEIDHLASEEKD